MLASTIERVPRHTASDINCRIRRQADERIRQIAAQPLGAAGRLRELDAEWDIERVLEANASTVAFTGIVLGATMDKRWLLLPALVTAFLFQHAIQGWCPPLPVLRRLGFRTSREIDDERAALRGIQAHHSSAAMFS
jgi:hypothetical protein